MKPTSCTTRDRDVFTGVDVQHPDSGDREYATLSDIMAGFEELGYHPLGRHIIFGDGD